MIRSNDYYKLLWYYVLSLRKDILYSSKYTKISNNLPLFDDDKTLNYRNNITQPTNIFAKHWFHINNEIHTITLQFVFTFYARMRLYDFSPYEVQTSTISSYIKCKNDMCPETYMTCNVSPNSLVMQNLSPFLTSSNNRNIWGWKFSWN